MKILVGTNVNELQIWHFVKIIKYFVRQKKACISTAISWFFCTFYFGCNKHSIYFNDLVKRKKKKKNNLTFKYNNIIDYKQWMSITFSFIVHQIVFNNIHHGLSCSYLNIPFEPINWCLSLMCTWSLSHFAHHYSYKKK